MIEVVPNVCCSLFGCYQRLQLYQAVFTGDLVVVLGVGSLTGMKFG